MAAKIKPLREAITRSTIFNTDKIEITLLKIADYFFFSQKNKNQQQM
jgi:hypothetical protein